MNPRLSHMQPGLVGKYIFPCRFFVRIDKTNTTQQNSFDAIRATDLFVWVQKFNSVFLSPSLSAFHTKMTAAFTVSHLYTYRKVH